MKISPILQMITAAKLFLKPEEKWGACKGLFGDYTDVDYDMDINVRIEKTHNLLKDGPNVIAEASFAFNNNFCSVDILKNDADGVEIYEVKSSTEIRDIYLMMLHTSTLF